MKICPNCHARFDGNEAFCPNDGSALVEARDLSPGALTGTTIGKLVILERLMWSDSFAERYSGRMVQNKSEVHVTVIQPGIEFASDAADRIEETRSKVGSPLPDAVATLLKTELDHLPAFVIQTAPRGPSLREVLDERGRLDWETAARVVCRVARASGWLLDQDVVHWALHPGSLHVVKLDRGDVQLGEWFFDSLMGERSPNARIKAGEPFPGYIGTMAPEVAAGDVPDERSVVFALGALFFELVTGKPPFAAATNEDTLERLQTESAVKLSIARGGGELHPELDDVIEMMLAKEPERRLQKPMAAVAVLSNILGSSPEDVAPPVERSDEAYDEIYATTEMSAFERSKVEAGRADADDAKADDARTTPDEASEGDEPDTVDSAKKTLLLGSPIVDAATTGAISGESSTDSEPSDEDEKARGAESQESTSDEETAAPGAPVTEEASDTDPIERSTKETLMMGRIGARVEKAELDARQARDDAAPDNPRSISGESKTLDAPEDAKKDVSSDESTSDAETLAENDDVKVPSPDLKPSDSEDTTTDEERETEDEKLPTDESHEAPEASDQKDADDEDVENDDESNDEIDPEETQKLDLATGEVESAGKAPKEEDEEEQMVVPPEADEWFTGTDDSLWERSFAEEHAEASEKRWKAVLFAALALVVFAGALLTIYSQFIYEPESIDEFAEEVVEEVGEEPEKAAPEVDLERLRDRFEGAMSGGRLITPPPQLGLDRPGTTPRARSRLVRDR